MIRSIYSVVLVGALALFPFLGCAQTRENGDRQADSRDASPPPKEERHLYFFLQGPVDDPELHAICEKLPGWNAAVDCGKNVDTGLPDDQRSRYIGRCRNAIPGWKTIDACLWRARERARMNTRNYTERLKRDLVFRDQQCKTLLLAAAADYPGKITTFLPSVSVDSRYQCCVRIDQATIVYTACFDQQALVDAFGTAYQED